MTICERLRHAITTASNDDYSEAGTDKRKRHVERIDAMSDAIVEIERLREDAARYRYLRNRPEDTIGKGGIFAGMTPKNVILTEEDLDRAIDRAMADEQFTPETGK